MKILTFGDSWAAGHGLKKKEKNFTDFLGEITGYETINFGKSGSSLGNILHTFIINHNKIQKEDFVTVIIPPDVRWYTESSYGEFRSMFMEDKDYKIFVKDKSIYWFKYHHSLFIYNLYKMCENIGANFIFAHNYGHLKLISPFDKLIPDDIFLNKSKSLTELLGSETYNNYSLKHDGPPDSIKGENFLKGDTHPNQKGHKLIASLILRNIEGKKSI